MNRTTRNCIVDFSRISCILLWHIMRLSYLDRPALDYLLVTVVLRARIGILLWHRHRHMARCGVRIGWELLERVARVRMLDTVGPCVMVRWWYSPLTL